MPKKEAPRRFRGIDDRKHHVRSVKRTESIERAQFLAALVPNEDADRLADFAELVLRSMYPEPGEDLQPVRRLLGRVARDLAVARKLFDAIRDGVDLGDLARAAGRKT